MFLSKQKFGSDQHFCHFQKNNYQSFRCVILTSTRTQELNYYQLFHIATFQLQRRNKKHVFPAD